jgi:hypothetical protein
MEILVRVPDINSVLLKTCIFVNHFLAIIALELLSIFGEKG